MSAPVETNRFLLLDFGHSQLVNMALVFEAWQHKERADGIMSGGGGILSYHVTWRCTAGGGVGWMKWITFPSHGPFLGQKPLHLKNAISGYVWI